MREWSSIILFPFRVDSDKNSNASCKIKMTRRGLKEACRERNKAEHMTESCLGHWSSTRDLEASWLIERGQREKGQDFFLALVEWGVCTGDEHWGLRQDESSNGEGQNMRVLGRVWQEGQDG